MGVGAFENRLFLAVCSEVIVPQFNDHIHGPIDEKAGELLTK